MARREQKGRQKAVRGSDGRFVPGETPEGARPWAPGQSGNPSGSSKARRLTTALLAHLDKPFPRDPGKRKTEELVVQALLRAGVLGNVPALKMIFDRIDGPLAGDEGELPPLAPEADVVRLRVSAARLREVLARHRRS